MNVAELEEVLATATKDYDAVLNSLGVGFDSSEEWTEELESLYGVIYATEQSLIELDFN